VSLPASTKSTLADRVAKKLRLEILSGLYSPGDKLLPEHELAARFDVNRFTVREAMNKLEQMHLIRRSQGIGTVVLDYNEHASIDVMEDLVVGPDGRINPFVVAHLLEAARVLSTEVAALAAERRNDGDLRKLCKVVADMRVEKRLSKVAALDFDFHWALAGSAGNIVPRLVLNSVRGMLLKYAIPTTTSSKRSRTATRSERGRSSAGSGTSGTSASSICSNHTAEHSPSRPDFFIARRHPPESAPRVFRPPTKTPV
jgi:GntR family transcriptional repressor for pyruvate dehydrogenase complex